MPYIKQRFISNKYRLYYVVSKRNSIKIHNNTKVRKIEYYLGDNLYFPIYINWYVWNNDIKLIDFLIVYGKYLLKKYCLNEYIDININEKNYSVNYIKLKKDIDMRVKKVKSLLKMIKELINDVILHYEDFNEKIDNLINYLNNYNRCVKNAKVYKNDLDTYYQFIDYGNDWYENYFKLSLNDLINYSIPNTIKEDVRRKIESYCYSKVTLESIH